MFHSRGPAVEKLLSLILLCLPAAASVAETTTAATLKTVEWETVAVIAGVGGGGVLLLIIAFIIILVVLTRRSVSFTVHRCNVQIYFFSGDSPRPSHSAPSQTLPRSALLRFELPAPRSRHSVLRLSPVLAPSAKFLAGAHASWLAKS